MNKPPSKRRESGTVAKLAKALGYTPRHTGTLIKNGMPDTLTEARQWLSERENSDTAAALRKERIGLVRAQRHAAELANKKAEGELIPRAEVIHQYLVIASAMQTFLRRLERELPPLLLGLPLAKSFPTAKAYVRDLQAKLSQMDPEIWKHLSKDDL